MKVENWPIDKPLPYARNPRKIADKAVEKVAASIKEYGFRQPIVVDGDGVIVAGHTRLLAARKLGLKKVPVHVAADLTPEQAKAYRLADNRANQEAEWDIDLLGLELGELQGLDFDLDLTAFDADEIDRLLADKTEGLTDPDAVPEVPETPVTVPGDVWLLGKHRIVCGDSTDADTVAKCLNGAKADCVFTSPPYGVGLDYGDTYEDTLANLRQMLPILAAMWLEVVERGGFAVINFGDIVSGRDAAGSAEPCEYPMAIEYWPPFRERGWYLWSRRVWCKPNARVHSPWAIQTNRAASDWENVWTWKAPGKAIVQRVNGNHQSANGWFDSSQEHGVDVGKGTHGAGMAVVVPVRMLSIHSRPGQAVYEPFSGSGTTIIAGEMTGRSIHAIELSPAYVDVAINRWQDFTGNEAVLESDGRTFEQAKEQGR